jgi:hypothetical protein
MNKNIKENPIRFSLGQDGEYLMIHNGKVAPLIGDIKGETGYDGIEAVEHISEVRTCPSEDPLEIINFIRSAFKRHVSKHPKCFTYDWQAGSFKINKSIGGHIHFGVKKDVIAPEIINRIIANYAGSLSLAVENKTEAFKRRNNENHNYGWLNDWRPQKWGMESRCFSSWLVSPQIAAAHLCLAKTVAYEVLNNKSFSPVDRFDDKDFLGVKIDKIYNHFDNIWSEITQMELYPQYKEYIDIFKFLIKNKLTWFPTDGKGRVLDMKETWGLADNAVRIEPKKIPFDAIWAKDLKDIF